VNDVAVTKRPLIELAMHRAYWRWVLATMLLRLPPIMAPMALILVSMQYTGSPAVGGLLVSVILIPGVLSAPFAGRLLDRLGTEKWTPRLLWLGGLGRLALAGAFVWHAPVLVMVGIALVTAMITSGISGATRTLLNKTVPRRLIAPALSVDSTFVEVVVVSAPFVVAVTALPGAIWSLVAMALATALGGLMLKTRKVAVPAPDTEARLAAEPAAPAEVARGVWRNPRFLFWVLVTLAFGHLLGTADVGALPRVAEDGGGVVEAAVLTGVLGVASGIAGLAYAWFVHKVKLGYVTQAVVLLTVMIASSLLMAMAGSWFWLLIAFGSLGVWTAPLNSVMNEAPEHLVPEDRLTEAFNILAAAQSIGFAIASGLLAIVPVGTMLLLGSATAILTLVFVPVLARRRAAPAVELSIP
jgi:MFS family permease